MARMRLVLLATIAALLAPWVAPCLASAPSGHAAMACCKPSSPQTPAARPCCAPADRDPAVPASAAVTLPQLAAPAAIAWTFAPATLPQPMPAQPKPFVTAAPRVLFAVLLI